MKTLYFECLSGISGDMSVAALLDLGADANTLLDTLRTLPLDGYHIRISRASKCGIDGYDFDVILDEEPYGHHGHDHHDHEHEHEHEHEHDHEHDHDHEHEHEHEHDHEHDHEHEHNHEHSHGDGVHHHPHTHRNLNDCLSIIRKSAMSDRAKAAAEKIFTVLARAESQAHGVPVEEVHFHEVGAVDSIVDIAAIAICLDLLDAGKLIFGNIREGCGTVWCQHGRMPVPVPAVANLFALGKVPYSVTGTEGEMVTPTGAAFMAALGDSFTPPAPMRILKTGIGAGKKDFPHANILRVYEIAEEPRKDRAVLIEANIDDQTGEGLGFAMERLLEAGALDCFFEPIQMKKNRPGVKLCLLCREEDREALTGLIFFYTSTIGVRWQVMERTVCQRESLTVQTPLGEARAKRITWEGRSRVTAEYESAREMALKHGISLEEAMGIIVENA